MLIRTIHWRTAIRLFLSLALIFTALPAHTSSHQTPVRVVPSVDIPRYMGRWYEIAHLPAWFQGNCASDTTATYTLRPDGKITVLNECRKANGAHTAANGVARLAGAHEPNTKLKVSFFWPFSGDYWIIDLDPNYRWAVVGDPQRRYLWILSRESKINPAIYAQILDHVRSQGYDLSPLIWTRHSH